MTYEFSEAVVDWVTMTADGELAVSPPAGTAGEVYTYGATATDGLGTEVVIFCHSRSGLRRYMINGD